MSKDLVIVKKTTLIERVQRSVFAWVAISAMIVAACVSALIVLGQTWSFNNKVIKSLSESEKIAEDNVRAVATLEGNLNKVNTYDELKVVRVSEDAKPIQTILDALPAENNSIALGSSVQSKLLGPVRGLEVDNISFPGVIDWSGSDDQPSGSDEVGVNYQIVSIEVEGSAASIKEMFQQFERSIRAFDVESVSATALENGRLRLEADLIAPYLPPVSIEVGTKMIRG